MGAKNGHYLAMFDAIVDFIIEMIPSAHLAYVHPARKSILLQHVSQYCSFILTVPLIANEYLGWLNIDIYNRNQQLAVFNTRLSPMGE